MYLLVIYSMINHDLISQVTKSTAKYDKLINFMWIQYGLQVSDSFNSRLDVSIVECLATMYRIPFCTLVQFQRFLLSQYFHSFWSLPVNRKFRNLVTQMYRDKKSTNLNSLLASLMEMCG